ncbi:thioredoxin domain-containing protein [Oscillatoria sp. FACHB-1406]|uniref:thioredoxin domain-containing protein n=1 Tax=Oscillatoria sp. FACHB-1406 TaxID=2692846 RepID=UPI00168976B4|nr:thioredoxin domain-containing protein [Oscillatoria sp. FACHB-1406]MBD2576137.1 thioredoxin domain-containing protein [Oscillatoria sp. FACHB-1406]
MSNRLAQSQSLYLRKHAENPIDWWPWCEEALAKADAENKPIFLSVGYSSCHWCTVMEGEAFSDRAIADYLNAHFVPVKLDREERPDLDSIYMQALQAMTGQGGWPLNIFLTPGDLVPFYGGTYFPIEPRYSRPGFLKVLQAVQQFYKVETEKLQNFKREILSTLERGVHLSPLTDAPSDRLLLQGIETSTQIVGRKEYGSPCFPMMPYSFLVLEGSRFGIRSPYGDAKQVARQRGDDLALGGIYDHVAGGFHRYTVDSNWTIPHFEKMLYDNGQILEYLSNLWSYGFKEPFYERAIAGTIEWLTREMTSARGSFYAAQDADNFPTPEASEPEEGNFYLWPYRIMEGLMTELEFKGLQTAFSLSPEGNFEGQNVLQRQQKSKLTKKQENALGKLFKLRYGDSREALVRFPPARNNAEAKQGHWKGRIPPVTDVKAIVAWNGLAISGIARAAVALDCVSWLNLAAKATNSILEAQRVNGQFYRLNYEGKIAVPAQSEDYAFFIKALLDIQQASAVLGSKSYPWLERAISLQAEFDELLWSEEMGGYYNTAKEASRDLLIRERSYIDNATPSANGIAIANLVRLALLLDKQQYRERAGRGLQAFSSIMQQSPQACPSLFSALDWYLNGTLVRASAEDIKWLAAEYFPRTTYQVSAELPEGEIAIVCRGEACLQPIESREALIQLLKSS